jgi:hypothetical protein
MSFAGHIITPFFVLFPTGTCPAGVICCVVRQEALLLEGVCLGTLKEKKKRSGYVEGLAEPALWIVWMSYLTWSCSA